jgi:AraC-like DNA-binding protein
MPPGVRTATLTGYAGLARSLGLDSAALMATVGLDISDLDVPDRWVPATPVARLLELSARESGREDFALLLSERRGLGALGPLSVVLRDEPDLRGVLDLLIRYEDAFTGVLDLRLLENDGLATVQVWLQFGEPVPLHQALDLTTAILLGIIRMLVRSDWTPLSAYFSHPAPADPGPYHRLFGPRVLFDQEFTGLLFHARELDAPVVTSDASVRPYSQQFLRTVTGSRSTTTATQAGQVVEALLPLGRSTLEQLGRQFGLSTRALQGRLAREGLSFSSIVHATRGRLAERYLANDRYSLTEISQLLGFAAPSAFSRWFHQRFGASPTEWRRAMRPDPPRAGDRGVPRVVPEG